MKANELRHGSYYLLNGKPEKYEALAHVQWELKCYERILLTPEILEKCGFYPQGKIKAWWHLEYYHKDEKIPFKSTRRVFTLKDKELAGGKKEIGFYYLNAYRIQFLHQLQNLYFALTGEELKINLTTNAIELKISSSQLAKPLSK